MENVVEFMEGGFLRHMCRFFRWIVGMNKFRWQSA